jgi:pimeloyl-ACP methyl ester carboxylesterase
MIRRSSMLILTVLVACSVPQAEFYDVAALPPHVHPGQLLRVEAFPGVPPNATARRILYGSTTPDGAPIVVSALVIVPSSAAAPGERPVLAWLHPTTGVARACAPSLAPDPFAQIQGLPAFLSAGYAVVATDYPGLGGPGVHPYLVGASEARAGIDSVRAARQLADVQAGRRFAVWGHSQGGHAALFAAEMAASYAPELQLVGAAAAAPVTDIAALVEQPGRDPLWGALLSYTVWSWSRVFGLDPDTITPASEATIARTAKDCLESEQELDRLRADAASLYGQPVSPRGPWRTLLTENAPRPPAGGVPVFLAQGDQDPVIVPSLTRDFGNRLCRARVPVQYLLMPGVDHYSAGVRSAGAAAAWIADRFAGLPPPDDCETAAIGFAAQ